VVLHIVGGLVEGLARPLVDHPLGVYPELVAVGKLVLVEELDLERVRVEPYLGGLSGPRGYGHVQGLVELGSASRVERPNVGEPQGGTGVEEYFPLVRHHYGGVTRLLVGPPDGRVLDLGPDNNPVGQAAVVLAVLPEAHVREIEGHVRVFGPRRPNALGSLVVHRDGPVPSSSMPSSSNVEGG
jgi:hypothetical protein